jgi:beta-glucosidase
VTASDSSCAADFGRDAVSLYYESIYVGYRFHDRAGTALRYPFGHGLSYTSFEYRDLDVAIDDGRVRASVTVTNTGDHNGAEVVQLYVRNNEGQVFKADKELRAFTKRYLVAGETERLELSFPLADLAYWDVAEHDWVLENGEYEVLIAASAAGIHLSAPLVVREGRASRSPYPRAVDLAYAEPPAEIPDAFAALLGRDVPPARRSHRLELETRLGDAKGSFLGGIVYRAIVGRVHRDFDAALALPASPERDAKVKSTHFVLRMMPSMSLRAMAMSSAGELPYHVAAGLSDLGTGHPLRGIRRLLGGPKKGNR